MDELLRPIVQRMLILAHIVVAEWSFEYKVKVAELL
jgi:hypothetical protein